MAALQASSHYQLCETLLWLHRLAWVAGFCLGTFGSNERTWKPFKHMFKLLNHTSPFSLD